MQINKQLFFNSLWKSPCYSDWPVALLILRSILLDAKTKSVCAQIQDRQIGQTIFTSHEESGLVLK